MTRRLLPLVAALVFVAAPATAQTTIDAAVAVSEEGYYLGPETNISESRVSDLVSGARDRGFRLSLVVLDESPGGGPTTFAGGVLDAIGGPGTVIVLTEDGFVGYETVDEFARTDVEAALNAADAAGGSDLAYLTNVVEALTGATPQAPQPAPAPTQAPVPATSSSGGGSGLGILLLFVAGFVAIVWFVMRKSKKAAVARSEGDIQGARREIQSQLDSMANDILDLADRVRLGGPKAVAYFEAGSTVYEKASEEFEKAMTFPQLEALSDQLDEAAWQLDSSQAILDGDPMPPKPRQEMARCFFDPTHRGPMVEATIKTSAGSKEVRVCKADAAKLAAGNRPDPRMIDVGGRRVPAPRAPKSHGGGGFGGMDLLSILVGGASQALPDLLGKRRGGGGLFGSSRRSSRSSSTASSNRGSSSRGSSGPIPGPSTPRSKTRRSSPPPSPSKSKRSRGGRRRRR
ncbi:MAG: hypothetical protein OES13_04355 [Acidimicrobiia bacterium]|nr:hypothetical protein [Acidimicrobiia bacterium]